MKTTNAVIAINLSFLEMFAKSSAFVKSILCRICMMSPSNAEVPMQMNAASS